MSNAAETKALLLDDPKNTFAATRSRIYALFAEAFDYPGESISARLMDGSLLEEIRTAAAALPTPIDLPDKLTLPAGTEAATELQITYTRLFEIGSGRRTVSLLERRYVDPKKPQQELWEGLLRFYSFFGLDLSERGLGENPDHLLIELEFMHYLSFLEAGASNGQEDLRRGQQDFLSKHLAVWIGTFCEALSNEDNNGPYGALAKVLNEFVLTDASG